MTSTWQNESKCVACVAKTFFSVPTDAKSNAMERVPFACSNTNSFPLRVRHVRKEAHSPPAPELLFGKRPDTSTVRAMQSKQGPHYPRREKTARGKHAEPIFLPSSANELARMGRPRRDCSWLISEGAASDYLRDDRSSARRMDLIFSAND